MWTAAPTANSFPHQGKATCEAREKLDLKEGGDEGAMKGDS